ncbi:YbaN family protein [Ancylobacter sp. VKM B-3255]|uniref:YbaN family protein n=2 Tax=Ancylobacter radicis TaxID=2836179 RepID=A0ABS5R5E0_9HYPH|nr:YbaN family protein [Ancylobacter radicis]
MRWVMFVGGWICVGLGIVGVIMPGMPGTVFLILAAWLFSRSSPRFEKWLLSHPRLGPSVVAWREKGAVPRGAQFVATGSMMASFGILVLLGLSTPVLGLIAVIFVAVSAYLLTRPSA